MSGRKEMMVFSLFFIIVQATNSNNDSRVHIQSTDASKGLADIKRISTEDSLCPKGCSCTFVASNQTMIVKCRKYESKVLPDKLPECRNCSYYLDFDINRLTSLTFKPYLWKTKKVSFRYNSIQKITLTALKSLFYVQLLNLENNMLERLPQNMSEVVFPSRPAILFGNNPWICDCQSLETRDWMMLHADMIRDKNLILCHFPPNMTGKNMMAISRDLFCPKVPSYKIIYIIVGAATGGNILLMIICIIPCFISKKRVWVYKKTKWHPMDRDECNNEGKEFDIFVSYANEDSDYIEEYIIPERRKHGFKICYHRVNFHGGKPITVNIAECIEKSKRTLVFFSRYFTESEFCMWEFSVALEMDLKDKTHRLVTIKEEDLDTDDLDITSRCYFKRFTFIRQEAQDFWDHLIYTLPLNRLGK